MLTSQTLVFGFPLFLVLLESVLRRALNVDSYAFLGPTLAAVGIGFAMSSIIPKDIMSTFGSSTQKVLRRFGAVVYLRIDVLFTEIIRILLVLMVSGWYCSLYCSKVSSSKILPLIIGVVVYVIGVTLSFVKSIIYRIYIKRICVKEKT